MGEIKKKIRVLILEDSEADTELILHEFKRQNYEVLYERVQTRQELSSALQNREWDVILADYTLPKIDARDGLKILHENGNDIPYIVVSGTIGEDVAVEIMKAGGSDYITKSSLKRLVPAVEREVREASLRREHREAEEELRRREKERLLLLRVSAVCGRVGFESADVCREVVKILCDAWCDTGIIRAKITCYGEIFECGDCSKPELTMSSDIMINNDVIGTIEVNCLISMSGAKAEYMISHKKTELDNVAGRLGETIGHKKSQKELQESEARFRHLIEGVAEAIVVLDMNLNILMVNDFAVAMTGYSRDQLFAMNVQDCTDQLIEQEQKNALQKLGFGEYIFFEFCGKNQDGKSYPVEINATKIKQGGQPVLLAAIRDITQRKQVEQERLEHNQKLINALNQAIQAIAVSLEMKDPYTAGHQQRVTKLAADIACEMGLSEEGINAVSMAASVHDIGKMYVPSEILSKPARLTEIEFSMVKLHAQAGYDVLKNVEFPWPIAQIVLQHHERMNGSGYPCGLSGQDILVEARILAVADVVESMASHRPYRPSLGIDKALDEIKHNRGTLYDPDVADACFRLFANTQYKLLEQ